MKKSSYQREQIYHRLLTELSERNSASYTPASSSKWIRLFCMYLANYSTIKRIDQVDKLCVEHYFNYLMENHKRLFINLTDIKKSMQMIEDLLHIKVDSLMNDFSLSNMSLWNKLK